MRARQRIGWRYRGISAARRRGRCIAVEHALTVRDLEEGLIERRGRVGDEGRPHFVAVDVGERAIDRVDALLHGALGGAALADHLIEAAIELPLHIGLRRASFLDQLIKAAVELGNGLGELASNPGVLWLGRGRPRAGGAHLRELAELTGQAVETTVDVRKPLVDHRTIAILKRREREALGQRFRPAQRVVVRHGELGYGALGYGVVVVRDGPVAAGRDFILDLVRAGIAGAVFRLEIRVPTPREGVLVAREIIRLAGGPVVLVVA